MTTRRRPLNWPFLQPFGIDQSNYRTTFRPWAIGMQTIDETKGIPGEWNYFGGNGATSSSMPTRPRTSTAEPSYPAA